MGRGTGKGGELDMEERGCRGVHGCCRESWSSRAGEGRRADLERMSRAWVGAGVMLLLCLG